MAKKKETKPKENQSSEETQNTEPENTDEMKPLIVGETGPEIFVPKTVSLETTEPAAENTAVTLRVRREHILTPHSVEIRRGGGEKVIEARTQDHRHSETIGAKTVQQILDENGAGAILQSNGEQLEITFSPATGEVVSILKFAGDAEESGADNSKNED